MPRVVCVYLPFFPTERLRRRSVVPRSSSATEIAPPPERPLVTVAKDGGRRVVAAVDAGAAALGLRPGLAVAQAQASVPNLVLLDASPDEDGRALAALAGWCLRYAPVVQADPPDGVLIEVEGAAHLLGGEGALLADLGRRLAGAGFTARLALADTPGAAWALARHGATGAGRAIIAPPGGVDALLAGLPVAALRLSPEITDGLDRLGIGRIGQIAALPRASLARRFGPALLARCDAVHGRAHDPLTPLVLAETPRARMSFAEPLGDVAGLTRAISGLALELCRALDLRALGLRRLDALFRRVDGRTLVLRIGTAAPTRDAGHLARLLDARLDGVDPGFGIDEVTLLASRTERLDARQLVHAGDEAEIGLGPLVDRLGIRFGSERVFRAAPVESAVPERSVRRVAALAPPAGASWPGCLPRPSRIFEPPERVEAIALLPDAPPVFFVWRRVRYRVRRADGPERVRGEWWRDEAELASLRDYYHVEDERGRRFWLFRDAPMADHGRWWLHGRFG